MASSLRHKDAAGSKRQALRLGLCLRRRRDGLRHIATNLDSTDLMLRDERTLVGVWRQRLRRHEVDADHDRDDAAVHGGQAKIANRLDRVASVLACAFWRLHVARVVHLWLPSASADRYKDSHDQLNEDRPRGE